jgi:two-component system sensor histidine kinase KdpD
MRNDSQWLVRMVENLLSVTRIDNRKVRLAKNETVLEELIDTVLVKFHKHYPQYNVTVCLPEDFISIPMDAILIQQVLMNLLENAVFHAHGMKNLWLTVTVQGSKAVFTISDDGCGIPLDRMESLFTGLLDSQEPTDNSRSNMGIGLSVCSAIVKAHGSEITARNKHEGGAEFSFSLELEEQEYGK